MTDIGRFAPSPAAGIDRLGQPQSARSGVSAPTAAEILAARPTAASTPEAANFREQVREIRVDEAGGFRGRRVEPAPQLDVEALGPAPARLDIPTPRLLTLDTLSSLQALTQPTEGSTIRLPAGFDPTRPFREADQLDQPIVRARAGIVPSTEELDQLFAAPAGDEVAAAEGAGEDELAAATDTPAVSPFAGQAGFGVRPGSIINIFS